MLIRINQEITIFKYINLVNVMIRDTQKNVNNLNHLTSVPERNLRKINKKCLNKIIMATRIVSLKGNHSDNNQEIDKNEIVPINSEEGIETKSDNLCQKEFNF